MLFSTVAIFAVAAVAAPQQPRGLGGKLDHMTVGAAQKACGQNLKVSCCNSKDIPAHNILDTKKPKHLKNTSSYVNQILGPDGVLGSDGVLSKVAEGLLELELLDQCSQLNVNVLINPVQDLLNTKCSGKVACCDGTQSNPSGGLVNVGLPCVALGGIVQ